MSDEKIPSEPPGDGSASKTEMAKPSGAWQMPKPVFRHSSGQLPKGFQKKSSEFLEMDTAVPNSNLIKERVPVKHAASPVIQDQPSLSEEFSLNQIDAAAPEPKKKGSALRIVLLVLAILAMLAFVIIVLTAVYLWFFIQTGESQNLN